MARVGDEARGVALHDVWRSEGQVVLTVLVNDRGIAAFKDLCARNGQAVALVSARSDIEPETLVLEWLEGWTAATEPSVVLPAARARVCRQSGMSPDALHQAFSGRSEAELERWANAWAVSLVDRMAFGLVAEKYQRQVGALEAGAEQVAPSLADLLGRAAPALFLDDRCRLARLSADRRAVQMAAIARACSRAASLLRPAAVAWSVDRGALELYLRDAPESSSKALVRQGLCAPAGAESAVPRTANDAL